MDAFGSGFVVLIGLGVLWWFAHMKAAAAGPFAAKVEPQEAFLFEKYGELNPAIVCSHCQTKGAVRRKIVVKKAGVSGSKATSAILTAGLSLLAVGLSKKEEVIEAHCANCKTTWHYQ